MDGDDFKPLLRSPNSQSLKDQGRGEDDTTMAVLHLSPGVGHPAWAVLVPEDAAGNPPAPLVLPSPLATLVLCACVDQNQ